MNRQSIWTGHLADRHIRLQRRMDDLAVAKRLFEDVIRFLESLGQVAAPHVRAESDVRSGSSLKVLEVGKGRCRFEHVVNDWSAGFCGLDLIEDCFQWLIFHRDQICCFLGDMRILRQRHGDRLAGIAHLIERQNRLIVKCRTVVRIRNEPADIVPGDHRVNALKSERRAWIDTEDFAVRNRTASYLPVEHSRQREIVNIFRAAIDLALDLQTAHRAFDLPRWWSLTFGLWRRLDYLRHCAAFSSARRTCTRTISRL